jgi:hypothetical protein
MPGVSYSEVLRKFKYNSSIVTVTVTVCGRAHTHANFICTTIKPLPQSDSTTNTNYDTLPVGL